MFVSKVLTLDFLFISHFEYQFSISIGTVSVQQRQSSTQSLSNNSSGLYFCRCACVCVWFYFMRSDYLDRQAGQQDRGETDAQNAFCTSFGGRRQVMKLLLGK